MNNEIINLRPDFIHQIKKIIDDAKNNAVRAVDFQRVLMYWHIGQKIFEEEQEGKNRAEYGTFLIQTLAHELESEYGTGFSTQGKRIVWSDA